VSEEVIFWPLEEWFGVGWSDHHHSVEAAAGTVDSDPVLVRSSFPLSSICLDFH
jgi:hypothetical protein